MKMSKLKWVRVIVLASFCWAGSQAGAAPRPAQKAGKIAALVDEAFGAIYIDSDWEEADILYAVRAALRAGASPNSRNKEGETLLLQAVENDQEAVVRLLIRSGADVNLADTQMGDTPLIRASYNQSLGGDQVRSLVPLVRMLLQRRADPNKCNKDGETALTLAAVRGYSDVVAALLKGGADFRLRNKQGFTPLQLASLPVGRGSISYGIPPAISAKGLSEHERMMERLERAEEKRLAGGRAKARQLLRAAGAKG